MGRTTRLAETIVGWILLCSSLVEVIISHHKFRIPQLISAAVQILGKRYEVRINTNHCYGGPQALVQGMIKSAKTFYGRCDFRFDYKCGYQEIAANDDPNVFFLTIRPDNFNKMVSKIYKKQPKKLRNALFGPIPIPEVWFNFPNGNPFERNFTNTLTMIAGWMVHSRRVRNHLTSRSNTEHLAHKLPLLPACTALHPKTVKKWNERTYDVIFFEKYPDRDNKKDGKKLHQLLRNAGLKIVHLVYDGVESHRYTREQMMAFANSTKFIIYFSFYDTGAIGLKEIQCFGVYSFSCQQDLVANRETGMYVPELDNHDMEGAVLKILKRMKEVNEMNPDAMAMAKSNQKKYGCDRTLHMLCDHIATLPTLADP